MAQTIEELLVSLKADVKSYGSDISKAVTNTDKSTNKMQKDFDELAKNTKKSSQAMSVAIGSFAGVLASNAVTGAFNLAKSAAAGLFRELVVNGVEAAQVQEDAIASLNQSLINAGRFSKAASQDMQSFASAMQSTTKIGDETSLGLLSLANNFARSNDEAKRMVEAAIELDAAMGIGLESALKNLGKTTSGLTGELGESLPALRSLTAAQLKAGAAVDLILDKFRGSAAAAAKTYSGALQQVSNTWGDTTEQVGFAITQNAAVIEMFNQAKSILEGFNGELVANNTQLKTIVGEGLTAMVSGLGGLLKALDMVGKAATVVFEAMDTAITLLLTPLRAAVQVVQGDFKGALDALSVSGAMVAENMSGAFNAFSEQTLLGTVADSLIQVGDAGRKALRDIGTESENTASKLNMAKDATAQWTELQVAMGEAGVKAATSLVGAENDIAAAVEARFATLQAQREAELISQEEFLIREAELREEARVSEQEALAAARDQNLITEERYKNAVQNLELRHASFLAEQKKKRKDADQKDMAERFQQTQAALSGLAMLQKTKSKEMAEVGKRAAQLNAIVAAYEGGNKAAAAVAGIPIIGPGLAMAVKAAHIASGIATASAIESQGFRFGTDSVPGFGRGDSVPAMLEPRERVVPRETNQDLTQFLKSQKEMMGGFRATGGPMESRPVRIILELADGAADIIRAQQIENDYLNVGVRA